MSTSDAHEVAEGRHGLGPGLCDEVTEDWYPNDGGISTCRIISSPAYVVHKRQTYPHWEMGSGLGQLRDEVFVKLFGSGRSEKLGPTAEAQAEAESHDVDRKKTSSVINPRIRATAANDNNDDDDFSAVSAQTAEKEREEPNNLKERGAPSAVASGHDQKQHNYLCAPSPNQPSVFTSFVPPHLPLATQFPALDPRVQSFLLSRPQSPPSKRERGEGRGEKLLEQEKQRISPTFNFSRLQMMVADSALPNDRSSSILQYLAGVHNQVQGSPQSPSLWRSPLDDESGMKSDSSVSTKAISIKDAEDDLDSSDVNECASMRGEPFSELGAGGHVFDYSFVPDYHSSMSPGCSVDNKAAHDDSASSANGDDFAPDSECACGHKRHYVRTFQDEDDEKRLPFYFCSEPLRRGNNSDRNHKSRGHNHIRQRLSTNTDATVEDYADADGSTRANASASNTSLFPIPDSRTSSEFYLSPNFPDSVMSNFFASGELLERLNTTESYSDRASTGDDFDNHRVYFPTHPVSTHGDTRGETKAPAASSGSLSVLLKLFSTTRHRVSSAGATALSTLGKNNKPPSSSASAQTPNISRPESTRSTPSAKAELEKGERAPKNEHARAKVEAKKGKGERRVLVKRGRSSIIRPLGARRSEHDYDYGLPKRSEPSISSRVSEKEGGQTGAGERESGKDTFLWWISQHMHLGHPKVTAKEKLTPSSFEPLASVKACKPTSSPQPEIRRSSFSLVPPPTPPPTPRSEVGQEPKQMRNVNSESKSRSEPESERWAREKQRRSRSSSGLSVLLRRFSLAGPKNSRASGDGAIERARDNRSRSRQT